MKIQKVKIHKTHTVTHVFSCGCSTSNDFMWCVCARRVGKRVRLRHELHSQCGHQRASGGRGRSQAGGD